MNFPSEDFEINIFSNLAASKERNYYQNQYFSEYYNF